MILAIDTGNTHTVLGCLEKDPATGMTILPVHPVAEPFRITTDRTKTAFEYAAGIEQIVDLAGVDRHGFEGAVFSSVVPAVTGNISRAVELVTGLKPLIVGPGTKTGIRISIDDPGTIGADLAATAVAVRNLFPLPCAVIDMGTATTITVVDGDGSFIGGAILPGVNISMNALTAGTSLLHSVDLTPPKKPIGSNTIDCMKSGAIYGTAGQIDGIIDRFEESMGIPFASLTATGGISSVICPYCRHKITIDTDLLLKGLGIIWDKNSARKDSKNSRT
ncbi:MAG: type III pantothenate kinase [Lachnospiraceae bacterium]|nr:type III pantothenate kinase [Lachnospiraceae bacterium]